MQKPQEMQVHFLGGADPLEVDTATHSSILAWEIPWAGEPGGLQSMGSQRVNTTERLSRSHFFLVHAERASAGQPGWGRWLGSGKGPEGGLLAAERAVTTSEPGSGVTRAGCSCETSRFHPQRVWIVMATVKGPLPCVCTVSQGMGSAVCAVPSWPPDASVRQE